MRLFSLVLRVRSVSRLHPAYNRVLLPSIPHRSVYPSFTFRSIGEKSTNKDDIATQTNSTASSSSGNVKKAATADSSRLPFVRSEETLVQASNREQFALALKEFVAREKYRRGHVAFINNAMNRITEFGLEKDISTYNALLDIIPRGKYHPKRLLDAIWPRPLPQTELALELLTRMEDNRVWPDHTTYTILVEVFGRHSLPVQKCERMLYWFDRYKEADPYWIEGELPDDPVELSKLTLQRIIGSNGTINEYDKVFSEEDTSVFLLSGMSDNQLKLLDSLSSVSFHSTSSEEDSQHSSPSSPSSSSSSSFSSSTTTTTSSSSPLLYIEGPHRLWLNKTEMFYFSLRLSVEDSKILSPTEDEGLVLGVCMCHPPTQASLQLWLRELQQPYPVLNDATVVYDIRTESASKTDAIGSSELPVGALESGIPSY